MPTEQFTHYKVRLLVNNTDLNGPELIEPPEASNPKTRFLAPPYPLGGRAFPPGEVSSPQRVLGQTEISRPGILLLLPDLPIPETIDDVIVHHSNRLHVGINDRRADEAESAVLEVLAECLGFGRSRWNLPRSLPAVKLGPPADKTPAVGVKVPELFLDFEECPCVPHCGFDLHPVANDLRIRCKLLDLSLGVVRDFLRIEFVERAAITFPLFQHERPTQS